MNEVKDQASHGGSEREDKFSHQVDNNQTSHIQAQFSNLSLMEPKETIITEDGHPNPLSTNPHASTEDNYPQNTIYIIRTPTALQNFLTTQPPTSIKTIRLVPLYPLESTPLTSGEQRNSHGPNLTPPLRGLEERFQIHPAHRPTHPSGHQSLSYQGPYWERAHACEAGSTSEHDCVS